MHARMKRLNADASYILDINGFMLCVDPWLIGPEIDGFSFFNCAWHAKQCTNVRNMLSETLIDAILITLPFSDHCHEITLDSIPDNIPIIASQETASRLRSYEDFAQRKDIRIFSEFPGQVEVQAERKHRRTTRSASNAPPTLSFSQISSSKLLDLTHKGVLIQTPMSVAKDCFLVAPHGLIPSTIKYLEKLTALHFKALFVTCSEYKLPLLLGGTINLGLEHATNLAVKLGLPDVVVDIHSEEKHTKGLVPLFAKTSYNTTDEIRVTLKSSVRVIGFEWQTL
jgi:hypothetical protein